jgi:hypothetical protein
MNLLETIRLTLAATKALNFAARDARVRELTLEFVSLLREGKPDLAAVSLVDLLTSTEVGAHFMPSGEHDFDPASVLASDPSPVSGFERAALPDKDALHVDGALMAVRMARNLRSAAQLIQRDPSIKGSTTLLLALHFCAHLFMSLFSSFSPAVQTRVKGLCLAEAEKASRPAPVGATEIFSSLMQARSDAWELMRKNQSSPLSERAWLQGYDSALEVVRAIALRDSAAQDLADSTSKVADSGNGSDSGSGVGAVTDSPGG